MDTLLIEAHSCGRDDNSPLQFVSAELLAHYRRVEAIVQALGALVLGALLAGIIVYVRASGILLIG